MAKVASGTPGIVGSSRGPTAGSSQVPTAGSSRGPTAGPIAGSSQGPSPESTPRRRSKRGRTLPLRFQDVAAAAPATQAAPWPGAQAQDPDPPAQEDWFCAPPGDPDAETPSVQFILPGEISGWSSDEVEALSALFLLGTKRRKVDPTGSEVFGLHLC
jgi:hypothetical protein